MRRTLSLLCGLLLTLSVSAFSRTIAPAPARMHFQGRLARPDGTSVPDGSYSLTFRIFAAAAGGTALWTQTFSDSSPVAVRNGVFGVVLDFGSGLASGQTVDSLLGGTPCLEIQVNGDPPLTPRQQLVSVAYALKANTVPDGSLTAAKFQGGTLTPGGNAGGDLTGTYPNPTFATLASSLAKVSGNVLSSDGSNLQLNDHTLYLRSGSDANHGLGYFDDTRKFGTLPGPNGPVLFGYSGGMLGTNLNGVYNAALYWSASGNVGIGTTSPQTLLDVNGAATLRGNTSVSGSLSVSGVPTFNASSIVLANSGIIQRGGSPLTGTGDLGLYSQVQSNWIRFVTTGGNIVWYADGGTGTTPIMTLQPNGELTANVVTVLGGSDVAEPYRSASVGNVKPCPGIVVAIDPAHVGQMRVCNNAYDKTVAGIVSGANGIAPGITLRQKGTVADGELPVASIGRVWCWCDADASGAIEAGDMLTTSRTPGHAMKVRDFNRANGAVIGKAMSALRSGKGLVLVLVSLQ